MRSGKATKSGLQWIHLSIFDGFTLKMLFSSPIEAIQWGAAGWVVVSPGGVVCKVEFVAAGRHKVFIHEPGAGRAVEVLGKVTDEADTKRLMVPGSREVKMKHNLPKGSAGFCDCHLWFLASVRR